jgi:HAD superfamily hydrolase (TIGR01509 family)
VRGVIFDLDGTLVVQELDFEAIRREIGLPTGTPLLEALEKLSGAEEAAAWAILGRHERTAALAATLNPGVADFLAWLDARAVPRGVLSRNSRAAVDLVLGRCGLRFDPVVAREDAPYKPSPQGIWQICRAWQLAPEEVLMVGDYLYDLQAGRSAGARTALVTHGRAWPFAHQADLAFASFEAVPEVLREWIDRPG